MRKMPIPQMIYVDGIAKVGFNCPDCHKSYDGVVIGGADAPKECECGCLFDLEGLFAGITCRKPRYCENCKYWADNEVCVNADSKKMADFTDKDSQCDCHEFKENISNEVVS